MARIEHRKIADDLGTVYSHSNFVKEKSQND